MSLSKQEGSWPTITICERQGLSRWSRIHGFLQVQVYIFYSPCLILKAFDICCWSWHKTSLLPHMEFFSTFGQVSSFGNVPSTYHVINLLIWFEYFPRPEVDLSQLERDLNETIRFGNININNLTHWIYLRVLLSSVKGILFSLRELRIVQWISVHPSSHLRVCHPPMPGGK